MIVTLKSEHDLADLLAVAGLARSTYYYHLKLMDQTDPYADLKAAITTSFENSKRRYGYRRVHMDLRAQGWAIGMKLVRKLMRILNFQSKARPKRRYNSYQGEQSKIAENLLARHFDVDTPDTVYVSDVTEFRVDQEKLYLSPIMDLFDHSILSYTIASSPTTAFTNQSLAQALGSKDFGKKLLVHTDQGFQYQHWSWKALLQEHGAVQSMSRKGNCFDNSVMENFFGHLKSEMFHGEHFADFEDLKVEIETYIDWYNVSRRQERLKGMTPMEYRCHTLAA
ncbi:IS3 family transposase [Glutamicibacter mysorens]|nr:MULTISPECIES: IS3 family transposase [Glutamicibacter]UTM46160.1 IS3 family transposase [Glutamicibacter mysorens]UTM46373.1 IS3 family transposase [Glutamicibacter mysorens]UTM47165.1 IS3 family transposase [Glutamicibacter mysorens]UTM47249.1 IS3 family transposase [Glutamicibacter mysorens]